MVLRLPRFSNGIRSIAPLFLATAAFHFLQQTRQSLGFSRLFHAFGAVSPVAGNGLSCCDANIRYFFESAYIFFEKYYRLHFSANFPFSLL